MNSAIAGRSRSSYNTAWTSMLLFQLFNAELFWNGRWNKEVLLQDYKQIVSKEFHTFIRLELEVSLLEYNDIKKNWGEGTFLGCETFHVTMSRYCFEEIVGSVCFTFPNQYDGDVANNDPFFSCQSMLDHFIWMLVVLTVSVCLSA